MKKDQLSFAAYEPLDRGWSGDRKYRVTDHSGTSYLLRVSPEETYENRRMAFRHMEAVAALGVPMCAPVAFGLCDEGVYALHEWIDGEDAETAIPALAPAEQYAHGLTMGRSLALIHTIPAPEGQEDWESRFGRKMDRKIELYRACPVLWDGEPFVRYIGENRHLLQNRPQTYQHGDFHIGNMMVDRAGVLRIIDFDARWDYGDPWEEFNRIVWCAQCAPAFASGMVDGYFGGGEVPALFWRLLALYISSNTLSSVPWAVSYGEEKQLEIMTAQAAGVLAWYEGFRTVVPRWYGRP